MSERSQFLQERSTGLGGSDAAPAVGVSPWKSPLELYLDKRGEAPDAGDTVDMMIGRALEPEIRQQYCDRTGRVVRVHDAVIRHVKFPWMIAHVDGIADGGRIFEAKTARFADGWGEPGSDQIPMHYVLQVQHYMAVTDLGVADVAVLFKDRREPVIQVYEIPTDRELQDMIFEAEAELWARVQRGDPPAPDWQSPRALDVVRALYKGTDGRTLTATDAQATWRRVLDDARKKEGDYKAVGDGALAHLLHEMGTAAMLKFDDGKILRRKLTARKGYTVEPTTYIDARFAKSNDKE